MRDLSVSPPPPSPSRYRNWTLNPDIALIITDLRMPEESGISLIKRLREHTDRQHLPVIVMSGHAEMDDVSDMLRLQVLDLFRKPIYLVRFDRYPQQSVSSPETPSLTSTAREQASSPQVYNPAVQS